MDSIGSQNSASAADMEAKQAQYEKRKAERKAKRRAGGSVSSSSSVKSSSTLDTHGFLSHLPEVNADIAYRFCFNIMGIVSLNIIEACCSHEVSKEQNLPFSPSAMKKKEEAFRCFSHVPFPTTGSESGAKRYSSNSGRLDPAKFSSDVPKLCKLIFTPCKGARGMPVCRTRFDALSSAMVCVLVIDPVEGELSFHEQLLQYERLVDQIRFRKKPLRPARAILLCRHAGEPSDPVATPKGHLSWQARLEEYEMCMDENMWKFGPVSLQTANGIHAAFATMASQRVFRGQDSTGEESDGSQQSEPPPLYEAEGDLDTIEDDGELDIILSNLQSVEKESVAVRSPTNKGALGFESPNFKSSKPTSWMSQMQKGAA
jgi:hypothetical protein